MCTNYLKTIGVCLILEKPDKELGCSPQKRKILRTILAQDFLK